MEVTPEEQGELQATGVIDKYRSANDVVAKALRKVIQEALPGKLIVDLCNLGDKTIIEELNKIYTKGKISKRVAFPTSIAINNVVGNFSPLADDKTTLKEGDLVKIELGAYIDGYIAISAETITLPTSMDAEPSGPLAKVTQAIKAVEDALSPLLLVGKKSTEIEELVQTIASTYKCKPLVDVKNHLLRRNVFPGIKKVVRHREVPFDDFVLEPHQAYSINIVLSTGDGIPKPTESKTTIYQKKEDHPYILKMKNSRVILSEINHKFTNFPFTMRSFNDENKARLAMTEIINHELVNIFPVLSEKSDEFVAQKRFTILVLPDKTIKLSLEGFKHFVGEVMADVQPEPPKEEPKEEKKVSPGKRKRGQEQADSMAVDSVAEAPRVKKTQEQNSKKQANRKKRVKKSEAMKD